MSLVVGRSVIGSIIGDIAGDPPEQLGRGSR